MFRAGDQIGPYTLVRKLGSGAFGAVWLADRQTPIATMRVALKVPHGEDIEIEAIKQEAAMWVQASGHPNVVPIIEANIYDGQVVIASEYIDSGSLEQWLAQNGGKAPTIEVAVEIATGILYGLEHLHSRHIIHRDLKPANLLLQGQIARLADFGISRMLKTTSKTALAAGTPSYMAPEAFDGKRNEQTDLWSVGVILYQMLAGRLPFPQTDMTSLIGAIVSKNPDPLPISVPAPLQAVINRAMAKDPALRFRTAVEMRIALRNAMDATRQMGTGATARTQANEESPTRRIAPGASQPVGNPATAPAFNPSHLQPTVPVAPAFRQPWQSGAPNQAKSKAPIIIAMVVAAALILGGIITAAILLSKPSGNENKSPDTPKALSPSETLRRFTKAMEQGDADEALKYISKRNSIFKDGDTEARRKMRDGIDEFQREAKAKGGIDSVDVSNEDTNGDTATVRAQLKYENGDTRPGTFRMVKEDGQWKIVN
ncbi:MAG TPA: protein kinase [Blastocatellia bacterium]|nr:protein kinase [Blastocatellia bacterium]